MLAVLAIAIALIGILSLRPGDAGASRMTERGVGHACHAAGGHIHYNIYDRDSADGFDMLCFLPSGHNIRCVPDGLLLECG